MSMNTTFKDWHELMNHLNNVDYPQCFTVNFLPKTNEYEIWIGNQPYYHYDKLIELEEKEKRELKEELGQWKELFFLLKQDHELLENFQTDEWKKKARRMGINLY